MSSVYADFQGPGSVIAAQLAVEDFAKQSKRKVEVLSADHQNKPDVGSAIARRWFDTEGVDMIVDLPNSAVALAVAGIAREKNKVVIGSGAGTALLTGASCSPNTVHWTYDTWAHGTWTWHAVCFSKAARLGFSLRPTMRSGTTSRSKPPRRSWPAAARCSVPSAIPIANNDFSSFLLQAQASGAEVIALANAGGDTVNAIKQAAEYKLGDKQKVVALIFDLQGVPAIGLATAQGLTALNAFYWDANDGTRAWSKRFQERHGKKMMPNHMHAGVYAGVLHYLKVSKRSARLADGAAVVAAMKAMDTDDVLFGRGKIREDGRKLHPMLLLQVKAQAESKGEWDVFKIVGTIEADKAFRPLKEGGCPLVK